MAAPLASYDPLRDVTDLTDLSCVQFIADQLNDSSQNQNLAQGAPRILDLEVGIVDIIEETAVQGSSILEVHIADPNWVLLHRVGSQPAFVDVDDAGLLLPVDVNFPSGTGKWWRLCSATASIDQTQANLVLTFEDRIVSLLRDFGGQRPAGKNQTRAEYIYSCVKQVPGIQFICPALTKPAGSVGGNTTVVQTEEEINALGNRTAPLSSKQPNAPVARQNPTKSPGISKTVKGVAGAVESAAARVATLNLFEPNPTDTGHGVVS